MHSDVEDALTETTVSYRAYTKRLKIPLSYRPPCLRITSGGPLENLKNRLEKDEKFLGVGTKVATARAELGKLEKLKTRNKIVTNRFPSEPRNQDGRREVC